MKTTRYSIFALGLILQSPLLRAAETATLIFSDDFERSESQEKTDEPGNGWGTNSKARAGGNKQVDLKDGAMYIAMHPTADHAVSVTHEAEFQNGVVELRFLLENEKDTLGLDFADLKLKEVHAGHLFKVTVGIRKVDIDDLKTGIMDLTLREQKLANTLTPEQKKLIASKKKTFPLKLESGKWYGLRVAISGDRVTVAIDGQDVGSFASEGFAHPTKRMLRLAVPKQAVVDDVKIYSE